MLPPRIFAGYHPRRYTPPPLLRSALASIVAGRLVASAPVFSAVLRVAGTCTAHRSLVLHVRLARLREHRKWQCTSWDLNP